MVSSTKMMMMMMTMMMMIMKMIMKMMLLLPMMMMITTMMLLINDDDDDLDDLDDDEEDERRMLRHIDMTLYYNIIANTSSNKTINNHQHSSTSLPSRSTRCVISDQSAPPMTRPNAPLTIHWNAHLSVPLQTHDHSSLHHRHAHAHAHQSCASHVTHAIAGRELIRATHVPCPRAGLHDGKCGAPICGVPRDEWQRGDVTILLLLRHHPLGAAAVAPVKQRVKKGRAREYLTCHESPPHAAQTLHLSCNCPHLLLQLFNIILHSLL